MKVIDADETRMINLPGVGPRPRPVDIDQRTTGFSRLKSLRIYRFRAGEPIDGESEADEVFILPLDGRICVRIEGRQTLEVELAADGPLRALYMARDLSYRLTPTTEAQVAYARAEAEGRVPTQAVEGPSSEGVAEHLRFSLVDLADGETLAGTGAGERLLHLVAGRVSHGLETIEAGQTLALPDGETVELRALAPARLLVVAA